MSRMTEAQLRERIYLARAHLRMVLEDRSQRDTARVRAAYELLGGAAAGAAAEAVQQREIGVGVGVVGESA